MKFNFRREAGNILMITLVMGGIMGVGLASYFSLVQAQNNAVLRSRTWNSAIPAAEAGLEDALTHLNVLGDAERGTNGWVWTNNMYWTARTFGTFRYEVGLDKSNQPSIYSTGWVQAPKGTQWLSRVIRVTTTRWGAGMRGMVAIGDITMNGNCSADSFDSEDPLHSTNGQYDKTKNKDKSYVGSVQANVDTGGGKVAGDIATGARGNGTGNVGDFAWLSSHSGVQPGHYQNDLNVAFPPVSPPFNSGSYPETGVSVVTTNYSYLNSSITTNVYPSPEPAGGVQTSTANYTSPTFPYGQANVQTNTASTTSRTFPAAGSYVGNVVTRVVTSGPPANRGTWYDYSAITGYSYQTTVFTYNTTATNLVRSTNTYDYVLRTGNYKMSSLSMASSESMLVTGDAVLYVTGDISMTGNSKITIVPGASLKIYAGGDTKLAGNGISNEGGDTTKFSYYGLPGNTSLAVSGNASFTGSIYAPNADFTLNGGGNNEYDFVGASVTKSVAMHGHFHFHYDERLGRNGGKARYSVASWNELRESSGY